jgi:hypothetical protein
MSALPKPSFPGMHPRPWHTPATPPSVDFRSQPRVHAPTFESRMIEGLNEIAKKYELRSCGILEFKIDINIARVRVSLDKPDISRAIEGKEILVARRISEYVRQQLSCKADVVVRMGSIIIDVIISGINCILNIDRIITSVKEVSEYVAKCIKDNRIDWPAVRSVLSFVGFLLQLLFGAGPASYQAG